jgi:response regulator RpfG family c-di-GMP phosphodiesterase
MSGSGARDIPVAVRSYLHLPEEPLHLEPDGTRAARCLTPYQLQQIEAGRLHRLRIGNYRVLEPLGSDSEAGGVYLAEHLHLHRGVALRVVVEPLAINGGFDAMCRRLAAVRQLRHEHVLVAEDVGLLPPEYGAPGWYVATPYIAGADVAASVRRDGAWPAARTSALVEQLARLLAVAHRQNLTHGALKPASIRIRPDGPTCLVDFGIGGDGDARCDLQALGRIMYLCLTAANVDGRPLCDLDWPEAVPPLLRETCTALLGADQAGPGLSSAADLLAIFQRGGPSVTPALPAESAEEKGRRILIVDDEQAMRSLCVAVLGRSGLRCDLAGDGMEALQTFQEHHHDLVLLDIDMPRLDGIETCRRLRRLGARAHLKILLMSGRSDPDVLASMLLAGADDFLIKPFTPVQLRARVQAALRLQTVQERGDLLTSQLLQLNRELETHLQARDSDLVEARNALVLALAKLVESRDIETGAHLLRLQSFSRRLADEARADPVFTGQLDDNFIDLLVGCTPLHDIGKVGLPDHILLKPGKLDAEERRVMQTHTIIGAETLAQVARQHGFALAFLQMAIDIARHHHERYDGQGYPDQLAGTAIPLAARIVAVCDVYDALRARRVYKPALPHDEVVAMMLQQAGAQFDPFLLACFERCAADFAALYQKLSAGE